MTLFFPDLNVWLALSDSGHQHSRNAWNWMDHLPRNARLVFSRFTQIGLLRLLTNASVMGASTLALGSAWSVYDRWLDDPRVEFYPEPRSIDETFRTVTGPFTSSRASKAVGDCWLLAFAMEINASLVTFDRAFLEFSRKQGHTALIPG